MKIIVPVNARLPTEKAHGYQIIKTVEALMEKGADVELVIPRRQNPITESIRDFYHLRTVPKITTVSNVWFFLEKWWPALYFPLQRMWFGLVAFWYVLWSSAEIVFSREITLCFLLVLCGKKNVIFEDHEPKQGWLFLYRYFIKKIPKKIIVAHHLEALYQQCGVLKESYCEIPNAVDVAAFATALRDSGLWHTEFGLPREKPTVLYVGHFYAWKGVHTLIQAAPLINANIVLVGGTDVDQKKIRAYIQEKNIENILVVPFVPHHTVPRLLASADVLILPNTSKEERSAHYTTPIKMFEYMAAGRAIVASRLPSFAPYLYHEQNAILFTPDDYKALAEAVMRILNDKTLQEKIAAQAQREAIQFSWEAREDKILQLVKQ